MEELFKILEDYFISQEDDPQPFIIPISVSRKHPFKFVHVDLGGREEDRSNIFTHCCYLPPIGLVVDRNVTISQNINREKMTHQSFFLVTQCPSDRKMNISPPLFTVLHIPSSHYQPLHLLYQLCLDLCHDTTASFDVLPIPSPLHLSISLSNFMEDQGDFYFPLISFFLFINRYFTSLLRRIS